jgi:hypothetical protein
MLDELPDVDQLQGNCTVNPDSVYYACACIFYHCNSCRQFYSIDSKDDEDKLFMRLERSNISRDNYESLRQIMREQLGVQLPSLRRHTKRPAYVA